MLPNALWSLYDQIDSYRRSQGLMLDMLGLGPVETPFRTVLSGPGMTLRAYGDAGDSQPVILIVPAPIKQAYIWDLLPHVSVVRRFMSSGIKVYLIHWERPGPHEQGLGLADYAGRLILDCVDAIRKESGARRVFLAGHSLGGTFGAIFSSLNPDRVRGLILAGAPIHFGKETGSFGPLTAAPSARDPAAFTGNVPGSFLDVVSMAASPETFVWSRWNDWFNSLADPDAIRTHICVERWTLDEMPLTKQLFGDIVGLLYREDRFMKGTLMLEGRRAIPGRVGAPLLNIVESRSRIVPPDSVLPFHDAVRSADKRVIWYEGDTGVALQHAGMLVGKSAHHDIWPEAVRWVHAH